VNVRLIDAYALIDIVQKAREKAKTLTGMDFIWLVEDQPAIDAIPVEWLRNEMNMADDRGDSEMTDAISWLLQTWREEHGEE
jgi:hypothetical protein